MNNVVGKYIKEIREGQGFTQEQLAIRIEMAGKCIVLLFQKLCGAIGKSQTLKLN
jgi:transcriptional regulator with XRE-family HTH domain